MYFLGFSINNLTLMALTTATLIIKDPAVQSLTAFVGVDGTNAALNSARLQSTPSR